MGDSYRFPRIHTAELNGKETKFKSYNKPGFWLESDAIQACKDAGIYEKDGDAKNIVLDGKRIAR